MDGPDPCPSLNGITLLAAANQQHPFISGRLLLLQAAVVAAIVAATVSATIAPCIHRGRWLPRARL